MFSLRKRSTEITEESQAPLMSSRPTSCRRHHTDLTCAFAIVLSLFNGVGGNNIPGDISVLSEIQHLVLSGRLTDARRIANDCLVNNEDQSSEYGMIPLCPANEDIIQTYKQSSAAFYKNENYLDLIKDSMPQGFNHSNASGDAIQSSACWDGSTSTPTSLFGMGAALSDATRWNECCSFYTSRQKKAKCFDPRNPTSHLCCYFSFGLDNHLSLPALKEPHVTIRLGEHSTDSATRHFIDLEQEGQLSLYDVSGVLWPSGYLLGLCLNDPVFCGIPEIIDLTQQESFTLALELGAGIGFPSIAFAKLMSTQLSQYSGKTCHGSDVCMTRERVPIVVAADSSRSSLSLIVRNSHHNSVGHLVNVSETDHMSNDSLAKLLQRYYHNEDGFDLIFGSSLQAFFDGTSNSNAILWQALDLLLSRSNSGAIVVMAHVRSGNERIEVPENRECNSFELLRRISGDIFLMSTRDGKTSDFELVVLKRKGC